MSDLCGICKHFAPVIGACSAHHYCLRNVTEDACQRFERKGYPLHSVKHQLPRSEGLFLVYRHGLPEIIHYDPVHGFGYWDGADNTPVNDVTHWMFCPPQPAEDFAETIGVPVETVHGWKYRGSAPSVVGTIMICKAFDVSADWLFGLVSDEEGPK